VPPTVATAASAVGAGNEPTAVAAVGVMS